MCDPKGIIDLTKDDEVIVIDDLTPMEIEQIKFDEILAAMSDDDDSYEERTIDGKTFIIIDKDDKENSKEQSNENNKNNWKTQISKIEKNSKKKILILFFFKNFTLFLIFIENKN